MKGSEQDRKEFRALRERIESLELVSRKVCADLVRFHVNSMYSTEYITIVLVAG